MSLKKIVCVILMGLLWAKNSIASCTGVGCSCTVATVLNVIFGNYNPVSPSNLDTSGTIQLTCIAVVVGNVSYTISLNAGQGGSFAPRMMTDSVHNLNYNLYTDATYTSIWGNGTGGTSTVSDSMPILLVASSKSYSVYGRIPASQSVPTGVYSDTITVTVTY